MLGGGSGRRSSSAIRGAVDAPTLVGVSSANDSAPSRLSIDPLLSPVSTARGATTQVADTVEQAAVPTVRSPIVGRPDEVVVTPVSDDPVTVRLPATDDPATAPIAPVPTPTPPSASSVPTPPSASALDDPSGPVARTTEHRTTPLPSTVAGPAHRPSRRRPRVRRVTRVVRHVDPWSAFKVGLLFSLVAYVICLTSGVLLWRVASETGTIDNLQNWFTQFGWETFELDGGAIYHNAWIIGLFLAVGATGLIVLFATLFNLVSDIVGGVRISVLEEEVVERRVTSSRRYVVRRPGTAALPSAPPADWSVDDTGAIARSGVIIDPSGPFLRPDAATTTADWSVDD